MPGRPLTAVVLLGVSLCLASEGVDRTIPDLSSYEHPDLLDHNLLDHHALPELSYAPALPEVYKNPAPINALLGGISRGVSALTTSVSLFGFFNEFYQQVTNGITNLLSKFKNRYYKAGVLDLYRSVKGIFNNFISELKRSPPETRYAEVLARSLGDVSTETGRTTVYSTTSSLISLMVQQPLEWIPFLTMLAVTTFVTLLVLQNAGSEVTAGRSVDIEALAESVPVPQYVERRASYIEQLPASAQ